MRDDENDDAELPRQRHQRSQRARSLPRASFLISRLAQQNEVKDRREVYRRPYGVSEISRCSSRLDNVSSEV